jgi:hypothetical protein
MTEATGTEIGAPPQLDDRLPIIVGITGHRDPRDVAKLREDLASALRRIDEITPRSPIWLLSPLAAGADQEFAEVGLDEFAFSRRLLGPESVRLIVPLPFELDDYHLDFESEPETRARFDRLLDRADRSFVLPPRRASDLFEHRRPDGTLIQRVGGSDDPADDIRSIHYDRLGRFMAAHAHVMIAAWDGRPSRGRGGTASIVDYCVRGHGPSQGEGIPLRSDLSPIERRPPTPILFVPCPRRSDAPAVADDGLPASVSFSHPTLRAEDRNNLERIDRINGLQSPSSPRRLTDSTVHHDRGPAAGLVRLLLRSRVQPGALPEGLFEVFHANHDADSELLARQFIRLDAWALLDKASYQLAAVVSAGVLGAALVLLQVHGLGLGAATRPAVFGYLIGLTLYLRWKRTLQRRESERAIVRPAAELLRIQIAWILGGIQRLIIDEIVPRRRRTIAPVEEILKGPMLVAIHRRMVSASPIGSDNGITANVDHARRWWVEDQLAYCDGSGLKQKRRRSKLMHRGRSILRGTVLAVALGSSVMAAGAFLPVVGSFLETTFDRRALPLADFLMGVSLVAVLVMQFLEAVTLDRQDVHQADDMRPLLEGASNAMNEAGLDRPELARRVLLDLGRSVADEQVEWFTRHKEGADLDIVG